MQKAEAQQKSVQPQPATRQGGGAALAPVQDERAAQFAAMIESSPQAEKLGGLASMITASPVAEAQRNRIAHIHGSPAMHAQGKVTGGFGHGPHPAAQQEAEAPGNPQNAGNAGRTGAAPVGHAVDGEKRLGQPAEHDAPGEVAAGEVAEAAGEARGEAAPEAQAGVVGAKAEDGNARAGVVGAGNKGGADVAIDFLDSPASVIARGVGQFGGQMEAGLQADVGRLAATTPAVTAGISTANIEPPRKVPAPAKAAAPAPGKWTPPVVALRSDAPKFAPAGGANPQTAETEAAAKGAQAAAGGNRLNAEIADAPGEELVRGRNLDATEQVRLASSKTSVQANSVPEMEEYMNIDMPEGFRRQVDAASAGMFRQSLAGPREQIENAKAKRDQDQAGAILNANRQADALGKKANEEQAQTIKLSRDQIGAEKEKSLAQSKSVLAEYDGKVSKEKQGKINEINAQIASHEKQANTALVEADTKVAAEQQKADQQKAAEERKGAEKKKKKRKWWQKIGDFFSNIAKSIAKAVTSIVNALASVVKSIVTAAKNLANSIINTCTSLVKKLLDTFASLVKGFLSVALAAFPAIRNRLNAFIDKFVSAASAAIDKIADTLKAAVNKLCDTLTQIIDFAQNFMVSMVQGAVMMFNAIITGNFADLPRIAFMTACNSLGLPGEELWSIVRKAAGQAMEIIKKPAKFLGNLIKAGAQGFGQFLGNIKQHLMSGLMGWLMGQVGQSGITLPEKFDGPSIFLLIRQVLGVTYEYVRDRAVGIIGEKNAARVEMVLGYLKRLFTDPAALFAELKEKATEMKDTFIDQIQDWAITTVIQKAMIKVTSMLIPGAGFVQAIYGMWQTLQFFIENIKRIAAVVNSLLDSLAEISKGAIGSAANFVEKTMVDTLPLVFTWLAKLIGIDGIGQKVRSIIDKLRTPVNGAVDYVINGAMKLGSAVVDKVKGGVSTVKDKLTSWWKGRKEFITKDGESHAVYVEGEGKSARIVVNPVPKQDVSSFLDKAAAKLPEDAKQKQAVQTDIAKARTALTALKGDMAEIETADQKAAKGGGETAAATDKERQEAQQELEGLAGTLQRIMEATGVALPSEGGEKQDAMAIDAVLAQPPSTGERTAEQKQLELDQATALTNRIVKQSKTTADVAKYFTRLTARYRLKSIRYLGLGTSNAGIEIQVNPITLIQTGMSNLAYVEMTGTQGITKVTYQAETLTIGGQSAKVGTRMLAAPLAPDHEPGSQSTNDSAQDGIMGELVNSGNTSVPNKEKYIKGHLLNDHVGGQGQAYNLFPITADANAKHLSFVEKYVKAQVAAGYAVGYEVKVTHQSPVALGWGGSSPYKIDADFDFNFYLLDSLGNQLGSSHTGTIQSIYNTSGKAPFDAKVEYAGGYDKINNGKSTPNVIGQTGQWQTGIKQPDMNYMDLTATVTDPSFSFPGAAPSSFQYPAFTNTIYDVGSSGHYINIRTPDVAGISGGSQIMVATGNVVTVTNIVHKKGGWTELHF